jgi:hypothetical protein
MKAATGTKIFGMRVGVDPKLLVGGLVVLAGFMFWYNSGGDDTPSTTAAARHSESPSVPALSASARSKNARRNRVTNDRGVLRIRPVDASRGDIDPTLRLDFLARLQSVEQAKAGRSLFEIGPDPVAVAAALPPVPKGPVIPVVSQQTVAGPVQALPPQVNIPLKFYGFVRPAQKGQNSRGLFLEGDNILIAAEGELIDHRYLVRELNAATARLEDTQIKQGQTLPVVPEARQQ